MFEDKQTVEVAHGLSPEQIQVMVDRANDIAAHHFDGPGGGTPVDLQTALGHYAEPDVNTVEGLDTSLERQGAEEKFARLSPGDPNGLAGFRIGEGYAKMPTGPRFGDAGPTNPTGTKFRPASEDAEIGDMSTPEARVAALASITQNSLDSRNHARGVGEHDCGPSALVGGALMAQGTQGLNSIMDAVDANCTEEQRKLLESGEFKDLRERIAKGEKITMKDLHNVEDNMYLVMKENIEGKTPEELMAATSNKDLAVSDASMRKFLATDKAAHDGKVADGGAASQDLHDMMVENHMNIANIDNDGDHVGDHFVLQIQDDKGKDAAVYDPYLRKEGQIINKADELADYDLARKDFIQ